MVNVVDHYSCFVVDVVIMTVVLWLMSLIVSIVSWLMSLVMTVVLWLMSLS